MKDESKWPQPKEEVIAYEYKCPQCHKVMTKYHRTKRIVCVYCGREFSTW